jgi:iron complex outermembrane receptor protein
MAMTTRGRACGGPPIWRRRSALRISPGAAIAAPSPISVRTTEYDIERRGAIGSATLRLGAHEIEGGFWLENNDFNHARRFYGLARAANTRNSLEFLENPFFTQWAYDFETETRQFYLQDTWTVMEGLTVSAGFKSLSVENSATTLIGENKTGTIKAEDNFLPQVGVAYDINGDHQLFASYAENIRAFESSNTGGPFSATAAGFAALRNNLQPESSKTLEAGWRFRFDQIQGSVAAYHVEFEDRLLGVALGAPILGLGNGIQNVGSVAAAASRRRRCGRSRPTGRRSVRSATTTRPTRTDVRDGAGALVAATAGKTVVNTPETLARAEVAYDDGQLFATLAGAFTGKRYSSYLNDESADAFTLVELTAGYRFTDGASWLNGTEIQLNVTNLLDEDYISTVGSGGFQNGAGRQTFLPGAPRQAFISLRRHF